MTNPLVEFDDTKRLANCFFEAYDNSEQTAYALAVGFGAAHKLFEAINVANGNKPKGKRKKMQRKDSVVLQRFHVKREHAIRTNVNDKNRKGYNTKKNKEHPYYGKLPFPKMENKFEHYMEDGKRKYKKIFNPETQKEENVVKDGYVDEESIQPFISAKMDENRDQIIRDMIDEKDEYTSKDLSEVGQQQGKNIPYWRLRSAKAKNDYIHSLREEHPDWTWLKKIPFFETETEEYLKFTLRGPGVNNIEKPADANADDEVTDDEVADGEVADDEQVTQDEFLGTGTQGKSEPPMEVVKTGTGKRKNDEPAATNTHATPGSAKRLKGNTTASAGRSTGKKQQNARTPASASLRRGRSRGAPAEADEEDDEVDDEAPAALELVTAEQAHVEEPEAEEAPAGEPEAEKPANRAWLDDVTDDEQ